MATRSNDFITIVKAATPVAKRIEAIDGKIVKGPVAPYALGIAKTFHVPDAEAMAAKLATVSRSPDYCIIPGTFTGAEPGEPFEIVTEKELARLLGTKANDPALAGLHRVEGREHRVAARLRRSISPSSWQLLDKDNAPGMPADLVGLDHAQRIEMLTKIMPSIGTCERITIPSTSGRVLHNGVPIGSGSHTWIRINDPDDVDRFRIAITFRSMIEGCGFESPKYSRKTPGVVIGSGMRGLFDWSVWVPGRIVFGCKPIIIGDGLTDANAEPVIENEGGGLLDTSQCRNLTTSERIAIKKTFKREVNIKANANGVPYVVDESSLTANTELELEDGSIITVAEWLASNPPIGDAGKLRCQSPFRESASMAAFIIRHDRVVVLHDVGDGTSYTLRPEEPVQQVDREQAQMMEVDPAVEALASVEGAENALKVNMPSTPEKKKPRPLNPWSRIIARSLSVDDFPIQIRDYAKARREASGFDAGAMAHACMVACSAIVPASWRITPFGDYRQRPKLWGALIADSGDGKTPIMDAAMQPVEKIREELRAINTEAKALHRASAEAARANTPRGRRAPPPEPEPPMRAITLDEFSFSSLADVMIANPQGLLLSSQELAMLIGSVDRYTGRGGGMSADRGFLLKVADGGTHAQAYGSKGGYREIPDCSAAVLGGIQPDLLEKSFADGAMTDDGLMQRFLPCYCHAIDRDNADWRKSFGFEEAAYLDGADALWKARNEPEVEFKLSPGATEVFLDFTKTTNALADSMRDTGQKPLASFLRKLPGQALRIALNILAWERCGGTALEMAAPVDEETIARAMRIAMQYRGHAFILYRGLIGEANPHIRRIAGLILTREEVRKAGVLTAREIQAAQRVHMDDPDMRQALAWLVDAEWITPKRTLLDRRVTAWTVNPDVFVLFANEAEMERTRRAIARAAIHDAAEARRAPPADRVENVA